MSEKNRTSLIAALALVAAVSLGCNQKQPAAQQTSPAQAPAPAPAAQQAPAPQPNAPAPNPSAAVSSDIIQSEDTNTPGVVGELIQCKRSDGVLSVKIRFHNTTGTPVNFYVLGTNISYERFYLAAATRNTSS